jgi:flagellar biosynthesis/type III secretory pathway protein FliH
MDHSEEIMTAGEQLIERGRKEGLEKGLKKSQEILMKLLRARFDALPEAAAARIHAATSAQLDVFFDRVLTAPTLDDVLADP